MQTVTDTPTTGLTAKERAEKRRIDRKAFNGTATRKELLRGLDLKRKAAHARQPAA